MLLLGLPSAAPAPAQDEADEVRAAEIKAAYLVNFVRYTVWPASSFEAPDTPIRVVVVGDDAVADELHAILERSPLIAGRPLEIESFRLPARRLREGDQAVEELRRAHALFLGESDEEQVGVLLETARKYDVLTVGDPPRFAALGGMIGLREEGRRIAFDANPAAIRGSRLQVSARVLQLARVVAPGGS